MDFFKLDANALIPSPDVNGEPILTVYALDKALIHPGERASIRTGIALEVPAGQVAVLSSEPNLSFSQGLQVSGGTLVFASHDGVAKEIHVPVWNANVGMGKARDIKIAPGDALCNLHFSLVAQQDSVIESPQEPEVLSPEDEDVDGESDDLQTLEQLDELGVELVEVAETPESEDEEQVVAENQDEAAPAP